MVNCTVVHQADGDLIQHGLAGEGQEVVCNRAPHLNTEKIPLEESADDERAHPCENPLPVMRWKAVSVSNFDQSIEAGKRRLGHLSGKTRRQDVPHIDWRNVARIDQTHRGCDNNIWECSSEASKRGRSKVTHGRCSCCAGAENHRG